MYAGCPSLVMTLWEINDRTSSELIKNFYAYLAQGKAKDEALRLAKLDYLNNSDNINSNPYYWAGYINFGNHEPLKVEQKSEKNYLANFRRGILILLLIGFVIFFKIFVMDKFSLSLSYAKSH